MTHNNVQQQTAQACYHICNKSIDLRVTNKVTSYLITLDLMHNYFYSY